jgi:cytochrome c-type biogenesis protein CcmH/NrfF
VALVAMALLGLIHSAGSDQAPTPAERAGAIAAGLRCPTCQGLSVADSDSPLAGSMRAIIDAQLAAGADDARVRDFFVNRYGEWVLLAPPARGLGAALWAVPALAVAAGAVAVVRMRRRVTIPQPVRWAGIGLAGAGAVAVLLAIGTGQRGAGELPTGDPLPAPAAVAGPAGPGAEATPGTAGPTDPGTQLALAAEALTSGRAADARAYASAVLAQDPANVDALLIRGLAPAGPGDPEASDALRRFLQLASPDHPGVPLARAVTGSPR